MPASPGPSLSTEDRVLLAAAHPRRSPARTERLARLLPTVTDWAGLIAHADAHGMIPLLHHHLRALPPDRLGAPAVGELARRARDQVAWSERLHRETLRVLDALQGASVAAMALKGSYLGDLLYGDRALRPMNDIDVLVRPEEAARARHALGELGYRRWAAPEEEEDYYNQKLVQTDAGTTLLIELHVDLVPRYLAQVGTRELWEAAARGTWEGRQVWAMAPPDLLLYLCLVAVKDGMRSLRSLLDIALVIERFGDALPWEAIASRARAAGMRASVDVSLGWTRALLGTEVPAEFRAAVRPRWPVGRALADALLERRGGVLHGGSAVRSTPFLLIVLFLWEASWRGRLRLAKRALAPSAGVRARWIGGRGGTSALRWYPVWLWRVGVELARPVTAAIAGPATPVVRPESHDLRRRTGRESN